MRTSWGILFCVAISLAAGCGQGNASCRDGGCTDGGGNTDASDGGAACDPACTGATPYCDEGSLRCVACRGDDDCADGAVCGTNEGEPACVPGCESDEDCVARGAGASCCAHRCVDVQGDPLHCGGCGMVCPTPAHGRPGCTGGSCELDSCLPGYKDCDQQLADGCEAHTDGDPQNCGACGNVCTAIGHASAACVGGRCGVGSCEAGWGNCDGDAANGCEVDLATDPQHCGGCGQVCPAPVHTTTSCSGGACGVGACESGYTDCDGNAANGCEAHLPDDARNCGSCGFLCGSVVHGAAACASGSCVAACDPGYADCDRVYANGCEVDTRSDASHCGGCGMSCHFAHGAGACDGGGCQLASCDAGYANCDGDESNGCEASLQSDVDHCGRCDNACAGSCVSGSCVTCQPSDLFILQDLSGSMSDTFGTTTRWEATRSAISAFANDVRSAGLGLGIGYFPLVQTGSGTCTVNDDCGTGGFCFSGICLGGTVGGDSCVATDYPYLPVEIALLPGNAAAIASSVAMQSADGGTPTVPALQGALGHAKSWAQAHPGHKVAVLLLSDGLPNECTTSDVATDVANVAATYFNGTPSIATYVLGVGGDVTATQWNQIAAAGGTGTAHLALAPADLATRLAEVRDAFKDCP